MLLSKIVDFNPEVEMNPISLGHVWGGGTTTSLLASLSSGHRHSYGARGTLCDLLKAMRWESDHFKKLGYILLITFDGRYPALAQ